MRPSSACDINTSLESKSIFEVTLMTESKTCKFSVGSVENLVSTRLTLHISEVENFNPN